MNDGPIGRFLLCFSRFLLLLGFGLLGVGGRRGFHGRRNRRGFHCGFLSTGQLLFGEDGDFVVVGGMPNGVPFSML